MPLIIDFVRYYNLIEDLSNTPFEREVRKIFDSYHVSYHQSRNILNYYKDALNGTDLFLINVYNDLIFKIQVRNLRMDKEKSKYLYDEIVTSINPSNVAVLKYQQLLAFFLDAANLKHRFFRIDEKVFCMKDNVIILLELYTLFCSAEVLGFLKDEYFDYKEFRPKTNLLEIEFEYVFTRPAYYLHYHQTIIKGQIQLPFSVKKFMQLSSLETMR